MLVSLSVSETKDFNLQSKMEISDDSEAITDSEEEYSRSFGKIVTVNQMQGKKRKTGHSTQQATIYFTLLDVGIRWFLCFSFLY